MQSTNITVLIPYSSEVIDDQGQMDIVHTVFTAAFGRIDDDMLLNKLDEFMKFSECLNFFATLLQQWI